MPFPKSEGGGRYLGAGPENMGGRGPQDGVSDQDEIACLVVSLGDEGGPVSGGGENGGGNRGHEPFPCPRVIHANRALCSLTGRSPENLTGIDLERLVCLRRKGGDGPGAQQGVGRGDGAAAGDATGGAGATLAMPSSDSPRAWLGSQGTALPGACGSASLAGSGDTDVGFRAGGGGGGVPAAEGGVASAAGVGPWGREKANGLLRELMEVSRDNFLAGDAIVGTAGKKWVFRRLPGMYIFVWLCLV